MMYAGDRRRGYGESDAGSRGIPLGSGAEVRGSEAVPSGARLPLCELLGLTEGSTVAFTGGGGKTSLVFHLAGELAATRNRVLITTTTKMFYPGNFPGRIEIGADADQIVRAFNAERLGQMFVAASRIEGGKVAGYDAASVDRVSALLEDAVFLVEADGAARKPYKFYREHEPVIPRSTTHVVHVIGAEVLDAPMGDDLFHRCPEHLQGEPFDLRMFEAAMKWYANEKIGSFSGRKILVVNKADEGRERTAAAMREAARPYFDACFSASLKKGEWMA